jgi:hypothetical protein
MSARPVHYAAAGTLGLAFGCYYRDLNAHLADRGVEGGLRAPLRHTDLRRVTCPECWGEIARMAQGALRGAAKIP